MSDNGVFDTIAMDRIEVQHMLDELERNRETIAAQRATYIQEREATTGKFNRLEVQLRTLQRELDTASDVAAFCIELIEMIEGSHSYTHHQKEAFFSLIKSEMRKVLPESTSDIPF